MSNVKATKIASLVLDYLKSRGELELLPDVINTLTRRSVTLGLQNCAVVTSATKLGPKESREVAKYIHSKYGADLTIIEKVDESLIAGLTIKVGDEVIDSSLATKLENIRKELV